MSRLLGTAPCTGHNCSEKVAVNETAGGSLSCKCQICKWSTFAPPGSRAARNLRAIMTAMDDPDEPAPPIHLPTPQKPPATLAKPAKVASSVFDLGQL